MSTLKEHEPAGKFWIKRTTLEQADRSFDIEFWQAQSAEMRLTAAADMIRIADGIKGYSNSRGSRAEDKPLERHHIIKYVRGTNKQ